MIQGKRRGRSHEGSKGVGSDNEGGIVCIRCRRINQATSHKNDFSPLASTSQNNVRFSRQLLDHSQLHYRHSSAV